MILIRNILIPTDFSESAAAALAYGKELAARFGSRLHVLHVIQTPTGAWEVTGSSWPMLLADLDADARHALDQLLPPSEPLAGGTARATANGIPVQCILDYANHHDIDLIVMGTHGRGFMGHMLLGSVAERVVRLATMPVLTVHGPSPKQQPAATTPATTGARRSEMAAS